MAVEEMSPDSPEMGGATTEQVMDAQQQQHQSQMEAIASTAPQPERPYKVKAIEKLVASMNDFLGKVDPNVPQIEFMAPEGEKQIDGPLPPEIYVPFAITMAYIEQMGGNDKFVIKPESLVNDTALAKASANFGRMGKNKALIEDMQEGMQGQAPEDEGPEMSPEDKAQAEVARYDEGLDEDDEAIMGM